MWKSFSRTETPTCTRLSRSLPRTRSTLLSRNLPSNQERRLFGSPLGQIASTSLSCITRESSRTTTPSASTATVRHPPRTRPHTRSASTSARRGLRRRSPLRQQRPLRSPQGTRSPNWTLARRPPPRTFASPLPSSSTQMTPSGASTGSSTPSTPRGTFTLCTLTHPPSTEMTRRGRRTRPPATPRCRPSTTSWPPLSRTAT
mmetsp:Transcript_30697/g.71739  ORF Transcript_30697/g.71739 Transcript_30697/m.71739 type:complete len:202 (+) Transcript_30697:97-702(+)